MTPSPTILGRWRITGMSTWDNDYIDLVEPGFVTFAARTMGEMAFGVVTAALDCAFDKTRSDVSFDFTGSDEGEVPATAGQSCPAPTRSPERSPSTTATTRPSRPAAGDGDFFSSLLDATMKILVVLTSRNTLANTGRKTGFWLEEFAAPYYVFKDAGAEIVLASPKGGRPPLDPKSSEPDFQTDTTHRFEADGKAMSVLSNTARLETIVPADFDAVFYPIGHGPFWDLAEDPTSIRLIESTLAAAKPVTLVCHAPGVLRHAKAREAARRWPERRRFYEHRGGSYGPHAGGPLSRRGRAQRNGGQ